MKILISAILAILTIANSAMAFPELTNLGAVPSEVWLGEGVTLKTSCMDNSSYGIKGVYADINGPNIILPTLSFSGGGNNFTLMVDKAYLDRAGHFQANIICENEIGENQAGVIDFDVSVLDSEITQKTESIYTDELIQAKIFVKKNGQKLSSDVNFTVYLNGLAAPIKRAPAYDINSGWVLFIDPPRDGSYTVEILASHGGASTKRSFDVEIKKAIEFEILSVEKDLLRPEENITVILKATDHGSPIVLTQNTLGFRVGSVDADMIRLDKTSTYYEVKVNMPQLSAGAYDLDARLDYGGTRYVHRWGSKIFYTVNVHGEILDSFGKGMSLVIKFIGQGFEKSVTTNNNGEYSINLPPGKYDVQIENSRTSLRLEDIDVSDFNNPVRLFDFQEMDVPGIDKAATYVYEVATDFSTATIEIKYDETQVDDESELKVYRCTQVNIAKKSCNSNWVVVEAEIDTVRNLVRIEASSLSAFVVGSQKGLDVNVGTDKALYNINEIIKVTGLVRDKNDNTPVSGTEVRLSSSSFSGTAITGDGGRFAFEFKADNEGIFDVGVFVEGGMFSDYNGNFTIKIEKSKKISLVVPEIVRLEQGQQSTVSMTIVNTGQTDMEDVEVSVSGVPESYFTLVQNNLDSLKEGTEKSISVIFNIPDDASVSTHSAVLAVSADGISAEKVFGLTIVGKKTNQTESTLQNGTEKQNVPITGLISFEIPKADMLIVLGLFFTIIPGAFVLKRLRRPKSDRAGVKSMLTDIKRELERK